MRPTGDEPNMSEPVHGTPSSGGAPEESWFRFGDEPGADGSAGAGPVSSEPPRVAAVPVPGAGPAPQSASAERHEPFVVSNTPGGVNPALMTAAETISFSVGRSSSGGGLVTALVVVMLLGIGGLAFWQGPRIAAAFGAGGDAGWHQDLQSALAEADASGRPVLMHFTADWCPPCKAMKKHVFSEAAVQERITQDFVPVRIDLSDRGGPNSLLAMELGITSIPAVRVYSSQGHEVGGFGFVGSAAQFNAELDRLTRR